MKSLLVDALRQKDDNKDSESLSDSGSFTTSHADPAATSADESDMSGASGDLELMATGAFIVANDDVLQKVGGADGLEHVPDAELAAAIAGATTRMISGETVIPTRESLPSMPPIARYTPVACAGLALLAAAAWFGIQQLELQQNRSQLSSRVNLVRADSIVGDSGIVGTTRRFRYLGPDGQPLDDEAWQ
ncbi:MAG: hypothetical protein QNJ14_06160 [Woeseiaceae bacterium]|nr:hypothetical protein [Woeseiaceae bacterium]